MPATGSGRRRRRLPERSGKVERPGRLARGLPSRNPRRLRSARWCILCLSCDFSDLMRCSMASIFFRRTWVRRCPRRRLRRVDGAVTRQRQFGHPQIVAATVSGVIESPRNKPPAASVCVRVMEAPLSRCNIHPNNCGIFLGIYRIQAYGPDCQNVIKISTNPSQYYEGRIEEDKSRLWNECKEPRRDPQRPNGPTPSCYLRPAWVHRRCRLSGPDVLLEDRPQGAHERRLGSSVAGREIGASAPRST